MFSTYYTSTRMNPHHKIISNTSKDISHAIKFLISDSKHYQSAKNYVWQKQGVEKRFGPVGSRVMLRQRGLERVRFPAPSLGRFNLVQSATNSIDCFDIPVTNGGNSKNFSTSIRTDFYYVQLLHVLNLLCVSIEFGK